MPTKSKEKRAHSFAAKLYVSLCIDAIMTMLTGDEDSDSKIVETILPLIEELYEGSEILS